MERFKPENCTICSVHFSDADFDSSNSSSKRQLKKGAIPSLNLPKSSTVPTRKRKREESERNANSDPSDRTSSSTVFDVIFSQNSSSDIPVENIEINSSTQISNSSSVISSDSQFCNISDHHSLKSEISELRQKVIDLYNQKLKN